MLHLPEGSARSCLSRRPIHWQQLPVQEHMRAEIHADLDGAQLSNQAQSSRIRLAQSLLLPLPRYLCLLQLQNLLLKVSNLALQLLFLRLLPHELEILEPF